MVEKTKLDYLRISLDEIDEEICILLAERQEVTKKIGAYKKENKLKPEDKKREQEQNIRLEKLGARYKLDDDFLVEIWGIIRAQAKKMYR